MMLMKFPSSNTPAVSGAKRPYVLPLRSNCAIIWTSVTPDLKNLRRFGCVVFVHTSDGKLNPRAKKGYFTGYPEGVKDFKIWMPEEKKVIISRDVVFREELIYKKEKKNSHEDVQDKAPSLVNLELPDTSHKAVEDSESGAIDAETSMESEDIAVEEDTSLEGYQLAIDRTRRQTRSPKRLEDYECDAADGEDIYAC